MANNGESSNTNHGCRLVFTMYGDQYEILIRRLPTPTSAPEDGNLYEVPVTDLNENHPNAAGTSANAHNPEAASPSRNVNMMGVPSSNTTPPSWASSSFNAHNHEWAGPSRNANMMDMPSSSTRPPGRARTGGIVINTEGAGPNRNVNMMDAPSSNTTPPTLDIVPYVGPRTGVGNRSDDFDYEMWRLMTAYINLQAAGNQNVGNLQIVPAQVPAAANLPVVPHGAPPIPNPLFPDIESEGVIMTTKENLPYEERRRGWTITYLYVNRQNGNLWDTYYRHVRSGIVFRTWPAVIAYINTNTRPRRYDTGMAPPRRDRAHHRLDLYVVGYFHSTQMTHIRGRERIRVVNRRGERELGQPPEPYTHHLFDIEPHDQPTEP